MLQLVPATVPGFTLHGKDIIAEASDMGWPPGKVQREFKLAEVPISEFGKAINTRWVWKETLTDRDNDVLEWIYVPHPDSIRFLTDLVGFRLRVLND